MIHFSTERDLNPSDITSVIHKSIMWIKMEYSKMNTKCYTTACFVWLETQDDLS